MITYVDTNIFDNILDNIPLELVRNFSEYSNSPRPKQAIFHAPFPRHLDFDNLESKLNEISNSSHKILIMVSELHDITTDFIEKFDRPNVVFFLNGDLNLTLNHAQTRHWISWFETTARFYKNNLSILDQLTPYTVKPRYFDILLGQKRPHRDFIYNYMTNNDLAKDNILTYLVSDNVRFQDRSQDEYIWEIPGVEIPDWPMRHTITKIKYYDQLICLSQIVPVSIYNQTAYSLVAETWGSDNRFTFNTEKIVKPILAERLFLVASNQYYLRNLRGLGFKTFENIVDESYDHEPLLEKRCSMICQQIEYLMSKPQSEILEQIRPITEYNKSLMLDTDWHGEFAREFQSVLLDHVD